MFLIFAPTSPKLADAIHSCKASASQVTRIMRAVNAAEEHNNVARMAQTNHASIVLEIAGAIVRAYIVPTEIARRHHVDGDYLCELDRNAFRGWWKAIGSEGEIRLPD